MQVFHASPDPFLNIPDNVSIHYVSAWLNVPGCLGSIATRTIGDASKFTGVKGGQAKDIDRVADFKTQSSKPPIPERQHKSIINRAAFGLWPECGKKKSK